MRLKFHLDLEELSSYTPQTSVVINFTNITNLKNVNTEYEEFNKLVSVSASLFSVVEIYQDSTRIAQFTANGIIDLSATGKYIEFDADITTEEYNNQLQQLIHDNIISLDVEGYTRFTLYKQTSANNVVNKTLQFVGEMYGNFNNAIGLSNIEIDVVNYDLDFNYVFIPKLNRYYYVDSINFITADLTRLFLKEDVLMSHKNLILVQKCLVTRSEYDYDNKLIDDRYPVENIKTVEYITPTPSANSLVNTELKLDVGENDYKIAVMSVSSKYFHPTGYFEDVKTPTGTNLPKISQTLTNAEYVYFMKPYDLQFLQGALINQSDIMSYILSAIILPFNPTAPFTDAVNYNGFVTNQRFIAKDDALCDDYQFHDVGSYPSGVNEVKVATTSASASQYFIVADFTISATHNNYLDYEPYTNYEVFVAFVGWVTLNATQILDKRLIVYYTIDFRSGMGTAYIYNITDQKLVWSSNCQVGIKIDLTATNQAENNRQKQANTLNMIMGLMSSALAIGVGVVTENPVAIAGGVLNAGKTIAGTVNSNMTMFERAQISFGSGDATFHANIDIKIRKTYNAKILTNNQTLIFNHLQGKPTNLYCELSDLTGGYVEVGDIVFEPHNAKIYQNEITEIVALLKNGVIL